MNLTDLQNMVASEVCNTISRPWSLVLMNVEYDVIDEYPERNMIHIAYYNDSGVWKKESNHRTGLIFHYLEKLREFMSDQPGGPWSICTLEVADTGRYKFSFSYDKPVRLYDMLAGNAQFAEYDPAARYKALTEEK